MQYSQQVALTSSFPTHGMVEIPVSKSYKGNGPFLVPRAYAEQGYKFIPVKTEDGSAVSPQPLRRKQIEPLLTDVLREENSHRSVASGAPKPVVPLPPGMMMRETLPRSEAQQVAWNVYYCLVTCVGCGRPFYTPVWYPSVTTTQLAETTALAGQLQVIPPQPLPLPPVAVVTASQAETKIGPSASLGLESIPFSSLSPLAASSPSPAASKVVEKAFQPGPVSTTAASLPPLNLSLTAKMSQKTAETDPQRLLCSAMGSEIDDDEALMRELLVVPPPIQGDEGLIVVDTEPLLDLEEEK